jgi:ribosomal protein S18 acetylase RimI-like enzyme
MNDVTIKELDLPDIHATLLETFNRYQETHHAWVSDGKQTVLRETHFIDDCDEPQKAEIIREMKRCLTHSGIVIGAFRDEKMVGFACVEGQLFGSESQYLELSYLHVSRTFRHQGIGKRLFAASCEKARQRGALKLYLGAHPSKESQAFYRTLDCEMAEEVHPPILQREPLDIQMEYSLTDQ